MSRKAMEMIEQLCLDVDGLCLETKNLTFLRCIQALVHACQCRDVSCRLASCFKMKRCVMHTKMCKRKTKGDCPICKQLIALCCYHAKFCRVKKCSVPFCCSIKQKMKQQRVQQSLNKSTDAMETGACAFETSAPPPALVSSQSSNSASQTHNIQKTLQEMAAMLQHSAAQATTNPVSGTKQWHQTITDDFRNHCINKLVQSIGAIESQEPNATHNLVAYARKVEEDIYETASTRSEYCHLIDEKIYTMQKEQE